MSKTTYLVISGILSFDYLTNNLTSFIPQDLWWALTMLWMVFGFFYFKGYSPLYNRKNQCYVFTFFILLFLSQLSPVFKYNQDYISTIIANRAEYSFVFLLVLCKIGPSEEELFKTFKILGITTLIMGVLVYFFPYMFVDSESLKSFLRYQRRGGLDVLIIWPGAAAARYYFYILVYQSVKSQTGGGKILLLLTLFMAYLVAIQNRSTLIFAVPCYLYALLKVKTMKKWVILSLIVIIGATYLYTVFDSLINESVSQLSDKKYNRWQAVSYYLFERDYSFYNTLFGNGRPASGSAYLYELVKTAKSRLAILSDIGLLGTFYIYGLSMILFIYSFVFKAIAKRNMPSYLRLYALWILLVPTIHCFGTGKFGNVILFALFFYNILLYEDANRCLDNHSEL